MGLNVLGCRVDILGTIVVDVVVVVDDRFYIVLFSALVQTRCARM